MIRPSVYEGRFCVEHNCPTVTVGAGPDERELCRRCEAATQQAFDVLLSIPEQRGAA